jgi:hypothetical protein
MSTLQEIEQAIRLLSAEAKWELLHRFQDDLWNEWDRQIEDDLSAGRLDALISEVKADIAAGETRPLHEVLGHS